MTSSKVRGNRARLWSPHRTSPDWPETLLSVTYFSGRWHQTAPLTSWPDFVVRRQQQNWRLPSGISHAGSSRFPRNLRPGAHIKGNFFFFFAGASMNYATTVRVDLQLSLKLIWCRIKKTRPELLEVFTLFIYLFIFRWKGCEGRWEGEILILFFYFFGGYVHKKIVIKKKNRHFFISVYF